MARESSAEARLHTHLDPILRTLVSEATATVELCSPFVTADTATWLAEAARGSSAHWTLLTKLSARSAAYGSLDLDGLLKLISARVELRHLDGLHAKVFIADGQVGFLGSANLTSSGLGTWSRRNAELTATLTVEQVGNASAILSDWWRQAEPITRAMITACEQDAKRMKVALPLRPTRDKKRAREQARAQRFLDQSRERTVWVKAVYRTAEESERPMGPGAWISSTKAGKPSFAEGDIVVIYAKDPKVCNAVVEVTGPTRLDAKFLLGNGVPERDVERWPWVTPVGNELRVPVDHGVRLERLGLSGQSLQRGHCRMPIGGLTTALSLMFDQRDA